MLLVLKFVIHLMMLQILIKQTQSFQAIFVEANQTKLSKQQMAFATSLSFIFVRLQDHQQQQATTNHFHGNTQNMLLLDDILIFISSRSV